MVYLTLGPWYHGQGIDQGRNTGAIQWDQDASKWWRHQVLAPFLAHYLKDAPMDVAPVTAFQSGTNRWQRLQWLAGRPGGCSALYLKPGMTLGFEPARRRGADRRLLVRPVAPGALRAAADARVEL